MKKGCRKQHFFLSFVLPTVLLEGVVEVYTHIFIVKFTIGQRPIGFALEQTFLGQYFYDFL